MSEELTLGVKPRVLAFLALTIAIAASAMLAKHDASASLFTLLYMGAALFVLDLFDLWLPHGDRIGIEGPILAAAVLMGQPLTVLALGLAARTLAFALGARARKSDELLLELANTAVGVVAAAAVTSLAWTVLPAGLWATLATAALAFAGLALAQIAFTQFFSSVRLSRRFVGLAAGNLRLQGPLVSAEACSSVLLVLTFPQMGVWSLVLVVILLLLLRQSYALLLSIRQSYMGTVEVLVDAAESSDPRRAGHSERTAALARTIGEELGLGSSDIERLSYAALLHDLDLIGADPEDPDAGRWDERRRAGEIISKVGFLGEVVPILRVMDGERDSSRPSGDRDSLLAFVVSIASEIDSQTSGIGVLGEGTLRRVAGSISADDKSRVVGAALRLGHSVPAVP